MRHLPAPLLAALLICLPLSALAVDACRPLRPLPIQAVLHLDPRQQGLLPRMQGQLARDVVIAEAPEAFGLRIASTRTKLVVPVTIAPQKIAVEDLVGGHAPLRFEATDAGPVVVGRYERQYLVHIRNGQPLDANGLELLTAPTLAVAHRLTVMPGAQVAVRDDGKVQLLQGSTISWLPGNDETMDFTLVRPARLEETVVLDAGAQVALLKPLRLLPGGVMKLRVQASGFDFRSRPLTFCFGVGPPRQAGLYSFAAPGKLTAQSGDGAEFEVRLPDGLAAADFQKQPGIDGSDQTFIGRWVGRDASIRVMGLDGDKVVFQSAQSFVLSNFVVALLAGVVLIGALFALSAMFTEHRNPLAVIRSLAIGESNHYSLSNVQVMLWTLLVLYAFCFVWVANGMLLDISSGVLVLLGISGGTTVLSRTADKFSTTETPPPADGKPKLTDLVIGKDGSFDLLRFQMLGFTLFTLAYSFVSVIHSEGLPDIPQNLYLLMGISSSAYLGGKVADNMSSDKDARADKPATQGEFERSMNADDVARLQASLGVPPTARLDDATRKAVADYKVREGIVPADGSVNPLFIAKVTA